MPSIRILSDRVANQIAAGEVIERPVAVVKELVENAIDAGATRIEIEFRNGGKSFIRIQDNGKGMSPDEALLCLERHATSKIREAADLDEVASFGFRGEALPSIASVSRFTLKTRTEGWDHGTEIFINGGKLIEKKECGMPIGTVIEVAHLFNSVPARRKFLKTDPTETAHITYTARLFAVAHPEVAFRVLENGRIVFQSPACNDLRDRISEIWGPGLARDLIPIKTETTKDGMSLHGLMAKPGVGRSTRRELITLVNRRPVDSRTLGFAVLDAYHGRIQKGRFPPAFLFLDINPRDVDVNVHPAKREVRFRDDSGVRRFVLNAISTRLDEINKIEISKISPEAQPKPLKAASRSIPPVESKSNQAKTPKVEKNSSPSLKIQAPAPKATISPSIPAPSRATIPPKSPSIESKFEKPKLKEKDTSIPRQNGTVKNSHEVAQWRFITLLKKCYALFESENGLIMMHIRQADQRVRFERIKREFEQETIECQPLLIPQPIELEPLAAVALESQIETLNTHGFSVEPFGRNFFRIEAVPNWLPPERSEAFLRDLIDMIRQRGESRRKNELSWEAIAKLATEGSFRKSDVHTDTSVSALAVALLNCNTPHVSPSGKPTYTHISWTEWAKKLGDT